MYTDYEEYLTNCQYLSDAEREYEEVARMTNDELYDYCSHSREVALAYIQADIDLYTAAVNDYVDADHAEETSHNLQAERTSLCYSQGLSY